MSKTILWLMTVLGRRTKKILRWLLSALSVLWEKGLADAPHFLDRLPQLVWKPAARGSALSCQLWEIASHLRTLETLNTLSREFPSCLRLRWVVCGGWGGGVGAGGSWLLPGIPETLACAQACKGPDDSGASHEALAVAGHWAFGSGWRRQNPWTQTLLQVRSCFDLRSHHLW